MVFLPQCGVFTPMGERWGRMDVMDGMEWHR
jgi:hypothetical protein